jgi:hypothetical protein
MRKIIIALLLCNSAFAQLPIDSTTHLITYTGIVQANGTQSELYSRAREWFAKTYNSAQSVIQMDNNSEIVGKALMQVYDKGKCGFINYTISVFFKDGKYKYEITNLYHTGEQRPPTYIGSQYVASQPVPDYGNCESMLHGKNKMWQRFYDKLLNQMDNNIKSLITSLKEAMNNQVLVKDF